VSEPPDIVVLLHGLARTHRIFWRMAPALHAAGFEPVPYRYPSRRYGIDAAVRQFRHWLAEHPHRGRRTHVVGFSLGAIVARGALAEPPAALRTGRLVMIGAPNRGAGVLSFPGFAALARPIFGPTVDELKEGSAALARLPVPDIEIGVIAGTGRYNPVNPSSYINLVRLKDAPHDGTVELANTRLDRMADFVALPVNHTFMTQDMGVIRATLAFLKTGRFAAHS
jgi:pimeloyl-ACP methyl ester carboxylesterase